MNRPGSGKIARPVVVLPHPDSPTRPTHSPASIVIEKSSTAVTKLLREVNWTLRLSTESSEGIVAQCYSSGPNRPLRQGDLSAGPHALRAPFPRGQLPARAVLVRGPVSAQRLQMCRRTVPLVTGPVKVPELSVQFHHHAVTLDFGEDRRGGDRRAPGVALHDRLVRQVGVGQLRRRRDAEGNVQRCAQQVERAVEQREGRTYDQTIKCSRGRDREHLM